MDTKEKTKKVLTDAEIKLKNEKSVLEKKNNATTIARLKEKNLYQVLNSLNDAELNKLSLAIKTLQEQRLDTTKHDLIKKLKGYGVSEDEIKKLYNK